MTETLPTKFISDDKRHITLPVPLGTTVYTITTACGLFCSNDAKRFAQHFDTKNLPCKGGACNTVPWQIYKNPLEFKNLQTVLETWGVTSFADKQDAQNALDKLIAKNRKTMTDLGFTLKENGTCVDLSEEDIA